MTLVTGCSTSVAARRRFPGLNGVRAFGALLVLTTHVGFESGAALNSSLNGVRKARWNTSSLPRSAAWGHCGAAARDHFPRAGPNCPSQSARSSTSAIAASLLADRVTEPRSVPPSMSRPAVPHAAHGLCCSRGHDGGPSAAVTHVLMFAAVTSTGQQGG